MRFFIVSREILLISWIENRSFSKNRGSATVQERRCPRINKEKGGIATFSKRNFANTGRNPFNKFENTTQASSKPFIIGIPGVMWKENDFLFE